MLYDRFRAMNSDIILAASGESEELIHKGFALVRELMAFEEQRFSRFLQDSELSQLNRSAGRWHQVSTDMFQVLQLAYRLSFETNGLFNPAILPALKQAGYDRTMDELRNMPPRNTLYQRVVGQDYRQIQLDLETHSTLLPPGMQIDLGGIAKGWIAEQAAYQLATCSESCAVNAGGDMYLINLPEGQSEWEVALENPLEPEQDLAVLRVKPGAVATSSTVKRQWEHNGKIQHHLIDPRTGEPAQTEWLSTTVWAPSAVEAEVYAKVLLIAGQQAAEKLFKNQTSKAYLAVDKQGWVHGSKNYHEVFHV